MTELETLRMWENIFSKATIDGATNNSGFGQAAAMVCLLLRDATRSRLRLVEEATPWTEPR